MKCVAKFIAGCVLVSLCLYGLYTADRLKSGITFEVGYRMGALSCQEQT